MDLGVAGQKTKTEMVCCRVACAGVATVIRAKGISGLVGSRLSLVISNLIMTIGLRDYKINRLVSESPYSQRVRLVSFPCRSTDRFFG